MLRKKSLFQGLMLFQGKSSSRTELFDSGFNQSRTYAKLSRLKNGRKKMVNKKATTSQARPEVNSDTGSKSLSTIAFVSLGMVAFSSFFYKYANNGSTGKTKVQQEKLQHEEQIIEFILQETKGEAALFAYKTPSYGASVSTFVAIIEQKTLREEALSLYEKKPLYWDVRMAIASRRDQELMRCHRVRR